MNEFNAAKVIEFYESLEQDLLNFLKIVPYEEQNFKTWSPKLIDIVVGAGSLLDSLFRTSMPEEKNGRQRKDYNINDFYTIFSIDLKRLRSFVYLSPPFVLQPYKDWTQSAPLIWWDNYNKVRHDRLENMRLATIQTAMDMLCGLFEAIVQNQKMGKALLRHSWTDLGGLNPDLVMPKLESQKLSEAIGMLGPRTLFVQSKLFATTLGDEILPDNISDIKPMQYVGSKRLVIFLGKWMGY
jgi:hypothetical protein